MSLDGNQTNNNITIRQAIFFNVRNNIIKNGYSIDTTS